MGCERKTPISASKHRGQTISVVVEAIARYSASVEDRETTFCFLFFQEIRESPIKIQKLVVDFRSVGSLAQLASEYVRNSKEEVDGNKRL